MCKQEPFQTSGATQLSCLSGPWKPDRLTVGFDYRKDGVTLGWGAAGAAEWGWHGKVSGPISRALGFCRNCSLKGGVSIQESQGRVAGHQWSGMGQWWEGQRAVWKQKTSLPTSQESRAQGRVTHTCAPGWDQRGPEAGHMVWTRSSPHALGVAVPETGTGLRDLEGACSLSPRTTSSRPGPSSPARRDRRVPTIHPKSTSPGTSAHQELSRESREKQGDS